MTDVRLFDGAGWALGHRGHNHGEVPEDVVNHHKANQSIDKAWEPAGKLVEPELGVFAVVIGKAFSDIVELAESAGRSKMYPASP